MQKDIQTRLLSATELVAGAFRLWWRNKQYIIPLCLAVYVPLNIIWLFLPGDAVAALDFDALSGALASGQDNAAAAYSWYMWVPVGVAILFTPLCAAALSYLTVRTIEGRQPKLTEMLDASLMRWGRLAYTALLYFLLIAFLAPLILPALLYSPFFLPLAFPVIYFAVLLMLYPCVVAISSKYGLAALVVSRALMRGRFIRGLALFFMNGLVLLGIQVLISAAAGMIGLPDHPAVRFGLTVATDCLGSVSYISVCLLYINAHYHFKAQKPSE